MSNVPCGKRKLSKKEFMQRAIKLHREIANLLQHDFGIKPTVRNLRAFVYSAKMSKEDMSSFENLCDKYRIEVEAEYPLWQLERYRNKILDLLDEMLDHLCIANEIYATNENEFNFRRQHKWLAMSASQILAKSCKD